MTTTDADIFAARLLAMTEPAAPEARASIENPQTPLTDPAAWVYGALGGSPSLAGPAVSERTALNFTAVYAAVRVICDAVMSLPLVTYRRLPRGRERATDRRVYQLLHDRPNPDMTSAVFRETLIGHVLLWGNFYAAIVFDGGGEPLELIIVEPHRVRVGRDRAGCKVYEVSGVNGVEYVGDAHMIHVPGLGYDGLVGYSVIRMLRQAIGLGLAAEEFGARFFGQGANLSGILESKKQLGPKAIANLRESFAARQGGLANAHKPAVLEEGTTWKAIGVPPEDAQFLETRKFQVGEIARAFKVPPHMIGDLEKATFSNIEHQGLEFVTHTLRPWLVKVEQELSYKLFPAAADRLEYFVEHVIEGLLRGDIKTRYEAYQIGRQNGWLNGDDIRELENMNPMEGDAGSAYLVNGNMIPVAQAAAGNTAAQTGAAPPPPALPSPAPEAKPDARALRPVFLDAFARINRREVEVLTRAAKRPETFGPFLDERFAKEHEAYVRNTLAPVTAVCGIDAGEAAARYVALAVKELRDAQRAGLLDQCLANWHARGERFADIRTETTTNA